MLHIIDHSLTVDLLLSAYNTIHVQISSCFRYHRRLEQQKIYVTLSGCSFNANRSGF